MLFFRFGEISDFVFDAEDEKEKKRANGKKIKQNKTNQQHTYNSRILSFPSFCNKIYLEQKIIIIKRRKSSGVRFCVWLFWTRYPDLGRFQKSLTGGETEVVFVCGEAQSLELSKLLVSLLGQISMLIFF